MFSRSRTYLPTRWSASAAPWGASAVRRRSGEDVKSRTDVAVVGGGIMGAAVSYWLKTLHPGHVDVTVIERDTSFSRASTGRSMGCIRQQFSLPENILLSIKSAEFLEHVDRHLSIAGEGVVDVQRKVRGYLYMVKEKNVDILLENYRIQREHGALVELVSPQKMKERWPWLNVDHVALGSHGTGREGWFDPWILHQSFRNKARALGVHFRSGDVAGFLASGGEQPRLTALQLSESVGGTSAPSELAFDHCFNCAGAWAGQLAQLAGVGDPTHPLAACRVPLPVEPRKRYIFHIHCPDGPNDDMPVTINPDGVICRREGAPGHYNVSTAPKSESEEPSCENLEADDELFLGELWPSLATYCHPFQTLKLKSSWAGYYDYNRHDGNAIVDKHPFIKNFWLCNGSSGHGVMHAAALSKCAVEYFLFDQSSTVCLDRFRFQRFLKGNKVLENYSII